VSRRAVSPRVIGSWTLPRAKAVVQLVIERDANGDEVPTFDAASQNVFSAASKVPIDNEDRRYFSVVILPQARKQIGEHYIARSDWRTWDSFRRHWEKKSS
jgi:hypothetical protein